MTLGRCVHAWGDTTVPLPHYTQSTMSENLCVHANLELASERSTCEGAQDWNTKCCVCVNDCLTWTVGVRHDGGGPCDRWLFCG